MPRLDLRFANNRSLLDAATGLPLVTFSRSSSATYVGSDGLLKTAVAGEPRFDHNPTTGESLGLLVEEARANLLLHNRTLTNAAWTASNITTAKNQVGVDGVSNSASAITASANNGTILQAVTSASAARATSAYVKRLAGTGPVEMTQNGTSWTTIPVTSGWSRVSIPSATVANPTVGFRIGANGDAIAVDYVQCENGSFITSAIEAAGAAVTRSACLARASTSPWHNLAAGTLLCEGSRYAAGLTTGIMGGFSQNSNFAQSLYISNDATLSGLSINIFNTTLQAAIGGAVSNGVTSNLKAAIAYQDNNFASAINGAISNFSVSGSVPSVINNLTIGSSPWANDGSNNWSGWIRRISYFSQRASNASLQRITR